MPENRVVYAALFERCGDVATVIGVMAEFVSQSGVNVIEVHANLAG
jgi:hypothetical protein